MVVCCPRVVSWVIYILINAPFTPTFFKALPLNSFFNVYLLISSSQHDCPLSVQRSLSPSQTNRRLQGLMANTARMKRESLKGLSHIDKETPSRWRGFQPPLFGSLWSHRWLKTLTTAPGSVEWSSLALLSVESFSEHWYPHCFGRRCIFPH